MTADGVERRLQHYWEDVQVGEELPTLRYPLTLTQMTLFTSSSQAWSPIHHDPEEARRRGYPDIFPGSMSLQACFSHLLMDFVGLEGWLKRFQVRYRRMNHPGVTLSVRGKVIKKYVEAGEHLLDLEVWLENERDGVTAPGTATVMLPSREQSRDIAGMARERRIDDGTP